MYQKKILIIIFLILTFACSKKEEPISTPGEKSKSFEIYDEAVSAMAKNDFFYASKKFSEAELILPEIRWSAKAALLSGYCFYVINFYEEAVTNLENYIKQYPADKNIAYAHYLIAVSLYEQILDEKKDISPLINSKKKIKYFIENFPDTEYSLDLKFKMDLINNQLAAKELYLAKYYIKTEKWIPAINRLKVIVKNYDETIFIEESLHRLVEIYYKIGLEGEAKLTASLLGYNYNSSEWYEQSYQIINKNYKLKKIQKNEKDNSLIKKFIKKIIR